MMPATEHEAESGSDSSEARDTHLRRGIMFARRRPKLLVSLGIIFIFYLAALFADFLAPYDYRSQSRRELLAPATALHFGEAEGGWHARPFIYVRRIVDPLERRYVEDTTRAYSLALFT